MARCWQFMTVASRTAAESPERQPAGPIEKRSIVTPSKV